MRIIAYSQDSGCRVGRAWKVKARLFQKFAPDDSIAALQLEDELNKLKFDAGKNVIYEFVGNPHLEYTLPENCGVIVELYREDYGFGLRTSIS